MRAPELRKRKMETTVSELIDIFITTKKTGGRSEQTLFWYRKRLTYFTAYLGRGLLSRA